VNCRPVIEMEMRSASRRSWTFRLRLLFFLAGALACLIVLILPNTAPTNKGQTMLVLLSFLGLAYCLGVGGFLTADCVSSEKRGGTLGLLLLTPLSGLDIVLGKLVCHGLEIFYGVCAAFPVFFLPLLAGGVTWTEVTRILLALTVALLLSPAIGLLVSVLGTESRNTMMTTFTSVTLLTVVPILWFITRRFILRALPGPLPQLSPVFTLLSGFDSSYRLSGGPTQFWGSVVFLFGLSALCIVIAGVLVGRVFEPGTTQSNRQRLEPNPVRRTPVPESNPYEWLLSRRAVKKRSLGVLIYLLLIFFVGMLVVSVATPFWGPAFTSAFFTALGIHLITKLLFVVEATWQINADRQSGALELVLVSALPEMGILDGHLHLLQAISRKPLMLLIALNGTLLLWSILFAHELHIDPRAGMMFAIIFTGGLVLAPADFAALRWTSLVKGLQAQTHPRAVLRSFSAVMVPPWIGMGLVVAFLSNAQPSGTTSLPEVTFLIWIALSLAYDWRIVQTCRAQLEGNLRRMTSESA